MNGVGETAQRVHAREGGWGRIPHTESNLFLQTPKEAKKSPGEHQGEVPTCHLCKVTLRRHLPNNTIKELMGGSSILWEVNRVGDTWTKSSLMNLARSSGRSCPRAWLSYTMFIAQVTFFFEVDSVQKPPFSIQILSQEILRMTDLPTPCGGKEQQSRSCLD